MITLSGKYKLVVGSVRGENEVARFNNRITDIGMDRLAAGSWINRIVIGTGTSSPLNADTELESLVASTTNKQEESTVKGGAVPWSKTYLVRYRFAVGEIPSGVNLSEIGCGWSDTQLFSRALIRDLTGEPTTISLLDDEYLDVIYELSVGIVSGDTPYTFSYDGNTYTGNIRPALASSGNVVPTQSVAISSATFYDATLGLESSVPVGTNDTAVITETAYTSGTYYKDSSIRVIGTPLESVGAASWTIAGLGVSFQASISPAIVSAIPEDITVRLDIRTSWSRE